MLYNVDFVINVLSMDILIPEKSGPIVICVYVLNRNLRMLLMFIFSIYLCSLIVLVKDI